jgi:hypothetical protein
MDSYKAVLSPTAKWPRFRMSHGPDEWLRVMLSPPAQVRHERTASTLPEGLSLWFDAQLAVVWSVDARSAEFCLGPTSELGAADQSMFYRVEAAGRGRRRRPRIPGIGDFADLRQLRLVSERQADEPGSPSTVRPRSDRDLRSAIPC